jgi:UDP-glucose 4-epimerase
MNVLVIGGSGFIGSHVCDDLTSRGHKVTIFDKHTSQWMNGNQKMVLGDIMDLDLLEQCISQANVVYHLAAIADIKEAKKNPIDTININIVGSVNIIDLCVKYSARLVYGSTVYVYSKHGSFYRASKQSVETLIEEYHSIYNLEYTIIRYGSLYGPRSQDWNGLKRIVSSMLKNREIVYGGTGGERREYIHVVDAARMSVDILDGSYNTQAITLTGTQVLTSLDLLNTIAEILDYDIKIKFDKNSTIHSHYLLTPYQYIPKRSVKLISNEYVDIGQGILELISEVENKENKEKI